VLESARQRLKAIVAEAPASVLTRVHVSTGSAAREIVEHAADMDADLVVVGRSRGFKLGSTAQRLLRRNERALLVVPSAVHRAVAIERPLAA